MSATRTRLEIGCSRIRDGAIETARHRRARSRHRRVIQEKATSRTATHGTVDRLSPGPAARKREQR